MLIIRTKEIRLHRQQDIAALDIMGHQILKFSRIATEKRKKYGNFAKLLSFS